MVKSFKKGVKADKSGRTLQHKLDRFLIAYRSAPNETTALSPVQLLLGRNVKTRLDLIKPDVREVKKKLLQSITRMFGCATTAEGRNGCVAQSLSEQVQSCTESR